MSNQYIDRGEALKGVVQTVRDSRRDPLELRKAVNFTLPDGKPVRRPGFGFWAGDETRIQGQQLTKQTPSVFQSIRKDEQEELEFTSFMSTPNSYGMIRGHADFSPDSTRDWTVEFQLTLGEQEELVVNALDRKTRATYGASTQSIRSGVGVYVFDQTLLTSWCDFNDGAGVRNLRQPTIVGLPTSTDRTFTDTIALAALAIGFSDTEIFATSTVIDGAGVYYPYNVLLTHGISYVAGADYHVAVRYTNSSRLLELIIDGAAASGGSGASTYTVQAGEDFAGETDEVNNRTLGALFERDIVLLNECTVRGAYSSTCGVSHIANGCSRFTQDRLGTADGIYNRPPSSVLYNSPPRGTGMSELRIWHEARSNVNLSANALQEITGALPANLKGYWRLNDGSGILVEKKSERHGSVHNTYPQYIADKNLLNSQGIKFADNQYAQTVFPDTEYLFDAQAYLKTCFSGAKASYSYNATVLESVCDFTVQMQITLPYKAQEELTFGLGNRIVSPLQYPHATEWQTGEIREAPGDGSALPSTIFRVDPYQLKDGRATPFRIVDDLGRLVRSAVDVSTFHPAYDQTLFSIEAPEQLDAADADNHADQRRIPLTRAVLDPSLKPCFEFFADGGDTTVGTRRGQYLRVQGAALTAGSTHTLTFRKRSIYDVGFPNPGLTSLVGYALEIWVDGAVDVSRDYITEPSHASVTNLGLHSRGIEHRPEYDVNIGASYVGDSFDRSETSPIALAAGPLDQGMLRMRCWQDTPGFFTLGFFRMWATSALSDEEIRQTYNTSMVGKCHNCSMIINYEIDQVTGSRILNKAAYTSLLTLGFKGWHVHNGDESSNLPDTEARDPYTWAHQDCLGYNRLPSTYLPTGSVDVPCNHVGFYSATIARTFGLMAIFQDTPFFDDDLTGALANIYLPVYGLMNEFVANQKWDSTVIGDQMVLTALGALPKAFNGRYLSTLGMTEYRGSTPRLVADPAGVMTDLKFYGVTLAYFAEEVNLRHSSPRSVVQLTTGLNSIIVENIQQHPDPRVTSCRIYRTLAQDTYAEAAVALQFLIPDGAFENKFAFSTVIDGLDADLLPISLDLVITNPPVGAVSASLNGSLWIAGDPLIPDTIYESDPGNPQRFDTISNSLVIEESSGEIINSILPIFGSLFVSKPSSIHRVDGLGNGQFNIVKLVGVGPVSRRAIEILVLPDDGRTVLCFWSKFGPYLFDGQREEYIGYPIEKDRADGKVYDWLDAESVFLLHDPANREVIFYFKSVTAGVAADRHDAAWVFNYRFRTWYKYGQAVASYALSSTLANSDTVSAIAGGTPTTGAIPLTPTEAHKLVVGGPNGHLYEWDTADRDGERTGVTVNPATVSSWSSPTITLTGVAFSGADLVRGNWITVYRPSTGLWFDLPAITNTTTTVELDLSYAAVGFAPALNDLVYIGQPVAELEFPWDNMGLPAFDKTVNSFLLWFEKAFKYRTARDWDTATFTVWAALADALGKRVTEQIDISYCEALKLALHSTELGARIDQLAYFMDPKMKPGQTQ